MESPRVALAETQRKRKLKFKLMVELEKVISDMELDRMNDTDDLKVIRLLSEAIDIAARGA